MIVADLNNEDKIHLPFNLSMILVMKKIEKVIYYGDKKQIKYLEKELQNNEVLYNSIEIKNMNNFKKFFQQLLLINNIFKSEEKNIVFLSLLPITQVILIYFAKKYKNKNIYVIHHSELTGVSKKNYWKIWKQYFWINLYFKIKKNENLISIVLGENIVKNLSKYIKIDKTIIYAINHPNIFNEKKEKKEKKIKKIKIASIGSGSLSRGTNYLFEVANMISSENIEFEIIGSIRKELIPYANEKVKYGHEKMLERKEYEFKIRNIDYAIYLYPENEYELVASGAIFDSIKFSKPIICLENDYFKEVFKKMGNIGYMCKNIEEIKNVIIEVSKIVEKDEYKGATRFVMKSYDMLKVA